MTTVNIESARSIKDAARFRGLQYAQVRGAAASGDLQTFKLGKSARSTQYVTDEMLQDWIDRVEARGGEVLKATEKERASVPASD